MQLNCLFYLRKISSWQNNCKVEICPHFFTVDFFLKFQTINETKNCWNIFFPFSNRLIENAYIKAKTFCGPQTDPINVSKKVFFVSFFSHMYSCIVISSNNSLPRCRKKLKHYFYSTKKLTFIFEFVFQLSWRQYYPLQSLRKKEKRTTIDTGVPHFFWSSQVSFNGAKLRRRFT